jgi:hypothetical protein
MADFNTASRFAVSITAADDTADGSTKAERSLAGSLSRSGKRTSDAAKKSSEALSHAFGSSFSKSAAAARLGSSEMAKAFDKGFGRSVDQAKKKTDAADKSIRSLKDRIAARWHTGGMGKAFDSVTNVRSATGEFASTLGGAFAPSASLTALFSGAGAMDLMSHFALRTNDLSRTSARYGVSPEMLQTWQGAAKRQGIDPKAVDSSLGAVTGHLYDYQHNRQEATQIYNMALAVQQQTGVNMLAALGKDANTFLRTLSRAMPKLSPGAQQHVVETFGVGGLWDLLRNPARLDQLLDSMKRLGVMSKDQVDAGNRLYQSFQDADTATGHFADTIESSLSPTLTPLLDKYTSWISELSKSKSAVDDTSAAVMGLTGLFGLTLVKALGKAGKALLEFNGIWLKGETLKKISGLSAGAKPGEASVGRVGPLTPTGAGMVGTGLAFSVIQGEQQQFEDALAAAKKKYGGDTAGLRHWFQDYKKAHPFTEPYVRGESIFHSPTRELLEGSSLAPPSAFELATPKVSPQSFTPRPQNYVSPRGGAFAQSGAWQLTSSNAFARRMHSAAEVAEYFEARGWTAPQARGIAAGAYAESRLDPNAINPKSGAYGIGQWLGARKEELFRAFGPRPTQAQQLAFMNYELRGGDRGGAAVQNAQTDTDALDAYIRRFERPAAGSETTRDLRRGNEALAELRGNDYETADAGDERRRRSRGEDADEQPPRRPYDDADAEQPPRRRPSADLVPVADNIVSLSDLQPINLRDLIDYEPMEHPGARREDNRQEIVIVVKGDGVNIKRADILSKKGPAAVRLRVEKTFKST